MASLTVPMTESWRGFCLRPFEGGDAYRNAAKRLRIGIQHYNSTGDNTILFNGTGASWSLAKGLPANYLGVYANDQLVMKWNSEWERGNAEGWANGPYKAWTSNEWNGAFPGGSGAVWHYKIVWVGNCVADTSLVPAGGYCIWGQFATIMDHGIDPSFGPGHLFFAHAKPTGYGVY